jgi:phosphatidylglycerophosphate synthase
MVLPFLMLSIIDGEQAVAFCLFLFAAATDIADGRLARRLGACTRFGTYWDSTADFLLIFAIFLIFYFKGYYPLFVPILLVFVFLQFVATSHYIAGVYDPIGKHYGSLLYCAIGLTLLSPAPFLYGITTFGIVIASMATLFSRVSCLLFLGHWKRVLSWITRHLGRSLEPEH